MSVGLSVCPTACPSVRLSVCAMDNESSEHKSFIYNASMSTRKMSALKLLLPGHLVTGQIRNGRVSE